MKGWTTFLLALMASAGVWFVHNLSRESRGIVSVPIVVQSNIDGRSEYSYDEVAITASCNASGFKLLKLERLRKPAVVFFNNDELDYLGADAFSIPVNELMEKSSSIFGSGLSEISFIGNSVICHFAKESCKKVSVEPVQSLFFRSQYTSMAPFVLNPDSVMVYADPQRLKSIDRILTRTISRTDIHSQLRGAVELDCPAGARLGRSTVEYSMEVTRYVELNSRVNLSLRNVPAGHELIAIPQTVAVNYRCPFPLNSDPTSAAEFYIDYRDFAVSKTGKVPVRSSNIPEEVITYSVEPEFCDCVEKIK